MLNELIKTASWRSLFSKESTRMKEQELLLRFFALYYDYQNYKKGLKHFLNDFMRKNRNLEKYNRSDLSNLFVNTINLLVEAVGRDVFRKGTAINAAFFDSVMIGVANRLKSSNMNAEECRERYMELIKDSQYLEYTLTSTADEKQIKGRIKKAIEFFAIK